MILIEQMPNCSILKQNFYLQTKLILEKELSISLRKNSTSRRKYDMPMYEALDLIEKFFAKLDQRN